MRTSRMQGKPPKKKGKFPSFIIIVIILGVAAYFVGAGAAGGWLAQNVIEPVFNSSEADAAPTDTPLVTPGESISPIEISENTGKRIEENIIADKLSLYTLQVGAYNDAENANNVANDIVARGGAGYVAYDGELYRVLIAGYTDREDASDVKQNLSKSSVDSTLFILESGSLEFVIGADITQVEAVKACFDIVPETVDGLQQVIYDYDNGKDVSQDLQTLHDNAQAALSALESAVDTSDGAMKSVRTFMKDFCDTIGELTSSDVDFSSKLKYNLISIVVRYSAFLDELSD